MFIGKLLEHQVEGVEFGLRSPYHINGYQVGLGKTIIALNLACIYKVNTLIVVPAYLKANWEREIDKFISSKRSFNVVVVSYTGLKKFLSNGLLYRFDFVIADEAQYLKNPKAQRTKIFHDLIKSMRPKYMSLLSGTPVKNRVSEFYSLLQLCYYGGKYPEFSSFNKLYYKFCNYFSYERTFEVNGVPIVRFDGIRRAPELRALIKPVYIRKKTEDVATLPDFSEIWVQGKTKKEYSKNLEEAFKLFEQDSKDPAYMSLKRANAMAKVKDTIALAKDMLEQGEKVIVYSDHVASAEEIAKALNIPLATGKVDSNIRGQIVIDFEDGKYQGISATIGALSTGVTLVSARHMIFNDVPFVPADLEQAKARIRRIGQTKKCFYHYIYNSDFDKSLVDMINRKNRDIRKLYD